jgi:predicted deacetylase
MVVATSERIARRGGLVRLSVGARQLSQPGVVTAMLDAVDTALGHGCRPQIYRWPVAVDVASGLSA